ncbi:MAG TPA: type IX secretion system protein PorQ, partial [Saprospiraceae bacterium]|nr:type IX secretion system protein PorQ [Saprospiraceae bacterium]
WVWSQPGAQSTFNFLSMPSSPRETSLGGSLITIAGSDISLAFANPSLLNSESHNRIFFAHNFLFAGIQTGQVSYARHLERWNVTVHGGIRYLDYGIFDLTDIFGNVEGEFSAQEFAFFFGASQQLNERLSVGMNIKYVVAQLAGFNAGGVAVDMGMYYLLDEKNTTLGVSLKNAGTEIYNWREELSTTPFDLQIGLTRRLSNAPFRFSIIAHQLLTWDLRYDKELTQKIDLSGNPVERSQLSIGVENFFRHFIANCEVLLGKNENFVLRVGYNHLRRRDLSTRFSNNMSGFGFGFGVKAAGFHLDYGVGYTHIAGNSNHIGIRMDMDRMIKKKL